MWLSPIRAFATIMHHIWSADNAFAGGAFSSRLDVYTFLFVITHPNIIVRPADWRGILMLQNLDDLLMNSWLWIDHCSTHTHTLTVTQRSLSLSGPGDFNDSHTQWRLRRREYKVSEVIFRMSKIFPQQKKGMDDDVIQLKFWKPIFKELFKYFGYKNYSQTCPDWINFMKLKQSCVRMYFNQRLQYN